MRIRIRELRRSKGLTLKKLGEVLGLGESTISQYENGKREPDNDTLIRLAEFFNVTVDYLLGRTDEPNKNNPLDKELEGIDFALWGEVKELTDAQKQDILDYIRFKKSQGGK